MLIPLDIDGRLYNEISPSSTKSLMRFPKSNAFLVLYFAALPKSPTMFEMKSPSFLVYAIADFLDLTN